MSEILQKPEDALTSAKEALARGDLFSAYDIASRAITQGDESEDLKQQQLLALARMGDHRRALTLFRSYGLDRSADPHKRALGARLLKDRALETKSDKALKEAYQAYRAIFKESEDPYPGINAATMALLVGDMEEARWLATNILVHPTIDNPTDYYNAATKAEASLILGKPKEAAKAIRKALGLPGGDVGARAGTLRQLTLLADAVELPPKEREPVLQLLRAPAAFHYSGHIFMPDAEAEARISAEIHAVLDDQDAGYAYGSAAAGADILLLEAVRSRGGDTHIVLPCRKEDFIAQSVRPAGEAWVARFEACIADAVEVSFATEMEFVRDPEIFGYGAAVAMGMARLRAQQLLTDVFQLAIWDGNEGGPVGTGADVRLWRERGGQTIVIKPGAVRRDYQRPSDTTAPPFPRRLASILFTDYAGFSKLEESALPKFDKEVMGRIAKVLKNHEDTILARNTWGDALYTVMKGAAAGAQVAVDLQRSLAEVKPGDLGLPPSQGGMRIAMHYGSVYHTTDQITGQPNFQGNEVARAARIEPVTPPGAVYVTEPMAAMIALEAPDSFRCSYVGRVDLAKKFGTFPMYRLSALDDPSLSDEDELDSDAPGGELMSNETAPTLFVSHHSSKLPVAEHVERALNTKGIKCWIAPRDVDPGEPFDRAVRKAIADTDAMLLLFCSRSEKSRHVKRELILADQLGKAIIPLRLERIDPGELSYHLADSQWIDWLEQRDVVIDRIAAKARDFQEQGGYEPSPPVISPQHMDEQKGVSSVDLLKDPRRDPPEPAVPPAAPAPAAVVGLDKAPAAPAATPAPSPAPAGASFSLDKGQPPQPEPQRTQFMPSTLLDNRPTPGPGPQDRSFDPSAPAPPFDPYQPVENPNRKGLWITLSVIGALLILVLAFVLIRAVSSLAAGTVTEAMLVGEWSETRSCADVAQFEADGDFINARGDRGGWTLSGNQLRLTSSDGSSPQTLTVRRVDNDTIDVNNGGTSFYRCN